MTEKRRGNPQESADTAVELHSADAPKNKNKRFSRSLYVLSRFCSGKQVAGYIFTALLGFVFWDACIAPPERQWLKPESSEKFLEWVEVHPYAGIWAFLIVIAACVILMIPMGTPLTLGCGYIYKGVYGWYFGIMVGTAVSVLGSAIGAITCFLLGRYLMRDRVRKWIRKYPIFDAIDVAISEQGFRIMAMLYMTPVLPLGPVSYMVGTTSMRLSSFAIAKVASLPLMILYVFIGASTGTLLSDPAGSAKEIEENKTLIILGILLSAVMITGISHYIRKELDKILGRQKRVSEKDGDTSSELRTDEVEMGVQSARHRKSSLTATEAAPSSGA